MSTRVYMRKATSSVTSPRHTLMTVYTVAAIECGFSKLECCPGGGDAAGRLDSTAVGAMDGDDERLHARLHKKRDRVRHADKTKNWGNRFYEVAARRAAGRSRRAISVDGCWKGRRALVSGHDGVGM